MRRHLLPWQSKMQLVTINYLYQLFCVSKELLCFLQIFDLKYNSTVCSHE